MVGLSTYTLEALCQDVANKKRRKGVLHLGFDGNAESYKEVWSAFGRYLSACLEQRKGLILSSFCKIGWQVERRELGHSTYRPLFRFSEKFCQAHMSREVARRLSAPLTNGAELCPFEDFNFSKAALKFSGKLTKDQVFTGLRVLVQRLGEAIGAGRCLDVALGDLGRVIAGSGGEPRFSFAPEIYTNEGLEPPADATLAASAAAGLAAAPTASAAFARSAATAAPAPARSLGLRGQAASQAPPTPSPSADTPIPSSGSSERPKEEAGSERVDEPDEESRPVQEGQAAVLRPSSSAPSLTKGSPRRGPAVLTGLQFKREMTYKQALDRQISEMEAKAARAVEEKEAWGQHVQSCLEQERDAIVDKKVKQLQNMKYLQHQMESEEERRREQRKEDIQASACHGFPRFSEASPEEAAKADQDQKSRLRAELDEQVRLNNTLRSRVKQHEREMEVRQLEKSKREMRLLREAEREKRSYDREALLNSWSSDIRMKNVNKAIDMHGNIGPSGHRGLDLESRASTAASSGGRGLCRPVSAGSSASRPGTAASRPGTAGSRGLSGSRRKTPLGASRSLGQLAGAAQAF